MANGPPFLLQIQAVPQRCWLQFVCKQTVVNSMRACHEGDRHLERAVEISQLSVVTKQTITLSSLAFLYSLEGRSSQGLVIISMFL